MLLHESPCAAHGENWGVARDFFSEALQAIPDGVPARTPDGGLRASAVLLHPHYGKEPKKRKKK